MRPSGSAAATLTCSGPFLEIYKEVTYKYLTVTLCTFRIMRGPALKKVGFQLHVLCSYRS